MFYYYSVITGLFNGFVFWILNTIFLSTRYFSLICREDFLTGFIALLCALLDFPAILYLKQNGEIYRYHLYNAIQLGTGLICAYMLGLFFPRDILKRFFVFSDDPGQQIDVVIQLYLCFFCFLITMVIVKSISFYVLYHKKKYGNKAS